MTWRFFVVRPKTWPPVFLLSTALVLAAASPGTSAQTITTNRAELSAFEEAVRIRQAIELKGPSPRLFEPRIVNPDRESRTGEWPWMVAIGVPEPGGGFYSFCGGSLIRPEVVLTAAHCAVLVRANVHRVVIGRVDLRQPGGSMAVVSAVSVHSLYANDDRNFDNDIALLRLASALNATPAALDAGGNGLLGDGTAATVIGWGLTQEGGNASPKLLQTTVPIVPAAMCLSQYAKTPTPVTANMVCAGDGSKDSCSGDSGGPLMQKAADGRWYQVGVVSFGMGCSRKDFAGVYTRLDRYASWLATHLK